MRPCTSDSAANNATICSNGRRHTSTHATRSSIVAAAAGEFAFELAAAQRSAGAIAFVDGGDFAFYRQLSRRGVLVVSRWTALYRKISRNRNFSDGTAALSALCVSVSALADQQSGHQLHEPFSQPRNQLSADLAGLDANDLPMEIYRIRLAGIMGIFVSDRTIA